MIVLGVDPGLSLTGWGVLSNSDKNNLLLLDYGCIKTKPNQPLAQRLQIINNNLRNVIRKYLPRVMAIEEIFFSKEAKTVAAVSQARGVIILAAAQENLDIFEYNPKSVKIALTGYGAADKNQIQQMVKRFLLMKEIPKPDDAADALALAICHSHTSGLMSR